MIFSAPIDLLKFPLTWRTFQTGDKIALQGMKGRQKKVSDLLSEQGLTLEERNRCLVLSDAKGRVLWVPGYRLSTVCTETAGQSGPRIFLAPQDPEG
jgi:tRNA(Ile)-lysidine synthetase-like protein